jgi:hypothetical protein
LVRIEVESSTISVAKKVSLYALCSELLCFQLCLKAIATLPPVKLSSTELEPNIRLRTFIAAMAVPKE